MTTNGGGWTVALWREPLPLQQTSSAHEYGDSDRSHDPRNPNENKNQVDRNYQPIRSVDERQTDNPRRNKNPSRSNNNNYKFNRRTIDADGSMNQQYPTSDWDRKPSYLNEYQTGQMGYEITRYVKRENFNRTWSEYKEGFGFLTGEHWLGK